MRKKSITFPSYHKSINILTILDLCAFLWERNNEILSADVAAKP